MSNQRHGNGPSPGKPHSTPAISPAAEVQILKQRLEKLERQVQEHFDERNQWNSHVRDWVGKVIEVERVNNTRRVGRLLWMDRYTLCVDTSECGVCIIHKGAVVELRLAKTEG